MKKLTLVAGAVLALVSTTSALAQSSVTLYGIVDAAVSHTTKQTGGSITRIDAGQLATSRWGMRGSEDLGGGMKANFTLESGISNDTGAAGGSFGPTLTPTASLFERAATVGVSGGFGAITLGRQNILAVDAMAPVDPIGFSQPGINPNVSIGALNAGSAVFGPYGTNGGGTFLRQNNSIRYALPTMSGFSGAAMYGFGEQAGNRSNSSYLGLLGSFNAGPITATLGYNVLKNPTNTDKLTSVGGGVKYAITDAIAVKASFSQAKDAVAPVAKISVLGVGVDFVVMPALTLTGAFYNTKLDDVVDAKARQLVFKANYALSKRTSVYTLLTNARAGSTADTFLIPAAMTPAAGEKSSNRIAVGVFHSF